MQTRGVKINLILDCARERQGLFIEERTPSHERCASCQDVTAGQEAQKLQRNAEQRPPASESLAGAKGKLQRPRQIATVMVYSALLS